MDEYRKSQHRLIVFSLLAVFILFLGYTILWEYKYFDEYGNFKRTTATVIEHYEEDGFIFDKFSYLVDDTKEVIKITPFQSKYDIGEKFTVYYDENHEIEVIYKVDSKRWFLPIITAVFGWASLELLCIYISTYGNKNKARN